MKLGGQLNRISTVILIDNGANYNFISERLVKEHRAQIAPTPTFRVNLEDGKISYGVGYIQGFGGIIGRL